MGLLVQGTPLEWKSSLEWLNYVRKHGVEQFIQTYDRVKDISGDVLKWGDELEYGILVRDENTKQMKVSLRGKEVLEELMQKETDDSYFHEGCIWVPEYGAWMVEATPKLPYGGYANDLCRVETNMRLRRARLLHVLKEGEVAPTMTGFPLLGVNRDVSSFDEKMLENDLNGSIANSDYLSDEVINPHPRFGTLTGNIRKRRGRKVDIRVPVYRDKCTLPRSMNGMVHSKSAEWSAESSRPKIGVVEEDVVEDDDVHCEGCDLTPTFSQKEPYPGFIHMDCMAFGMGMCCLQVTFQAKNIHESRHLYDHLAVLSPIFLALTAATPIIKGYLCDTDVRWATISAAVDDRTPVESGEQKDISENLVEDYNKMAGGGKKRLPKSRYEGISLYICNHKHGSDPNSSLDLYNDIDIPYDEESYTTLVGRGVDSSLAKHIAHLFIRDPLVIYSERIHLDDTKETDHFENIQSTNWQTVRWKPPPPKLADSAQTHVGWRTEFRSMEIQITDFENAAFSVFVVLVSRVILAFDLNLYTPLSKVEHNMEVAHRINAVENEQFYFRCHLAPPEDDDCLDQSVDCNVHADNNKCELMTIAEIMLGKGTYYPGLIPLVKAYVEYIECDEKTTSLLLKYISLIEKRSTGELPTAATWIRNFVRTHPDYKFDSIVTPEICYDLIEECKQIGEGLKACPDLLGDFTIPPIRQQQAYSAVLRSNSLEQSKRSALLKRYTTRGGN